MSIIAVEYTYVNRPELLAEHRPAHREFLASLRADGTLVASGPLGDAGESALLLLRAEAPEQALGLLDRDPFLAVGVIAERTAQVWNVVIGAECFDAR